MTGLNARYFGMVVLAAGAVTLAARAQPVVNLSLDAGSVRYPFIATNGWLQAASAAATTNQAEAIYTFTLTNSGDYVLRARIDGPGVKPAFLSLNIDAEPSDPGMQWEAAPTHGVEPRFVTWRGHLFAQPKFLRPKAFHLSAGAHRLVVQGHGGELKLEGMELDLLPPAPPTSLRVGTGP